MFGQANWWVPATIAVIGALYAAASDRKAFRIPDRLTWPMMATGLAYYGITAGWPGVGFSLGGIVVGFGVLFLLFAAGLMGAGDVKLMGGLGAWLGAQAVLYVFLAAALLNAAYSIVVLVRRGKAGRLFAFADRSFWRPEAITHRVDGDESLAHALKASDEEKEEKPVVPFGVMIGFGVVIVVCMQLVERLL